MHLHVPNVDRNIEQEASIKTLKGSSRDSSNISKGIVRHKHMAASEKYSRQQYAAVCVVKLKVVKSQ